MYPVEYNYEAPLTEEIMDKARMQALATVYTKFYRVDFEKWCKAYMLKKDDINDWDEIKKLLNENFGIRTTFIES